MARPTLTSVLPIDVEVVRAALRFTAIRPVHAVAMAGGSPWTVRSSLRRLTHDGMLAPRHTVIELTDRDGRTRSTPTVVYVATPRGAAHAGSWFVPGYDDAVSLPAPRPSAALASHIDGVASLAAWYRHFGYQVVAEREIVSLERPSRITPDRQVLSQWAVTTQRGVLHPPDLIAVTGSGRALAVELERATRNVADYLDVVGAYQAAGVAQVWHVLSSATAQRLARACHRLGIKVAPTPFGVNVSEDGMFRLQAWLPGRAAGGGPETWATSRNFPHAPPAGIAVPTPLPDLSQAWRRGSVVDPNVPRGPEAILVA